MQCVTWYIAFVLFGSSLLGKPAYAVEWYTLVQTCHCSIKFCYSQAESLNWICGSNIRDTYDVGCVAGYMAFVLFGSSLPGKPAYAVECQSVVQTWHSSCFFF